MVQPVCFHVFDLFPIPIEAFTPNGVSAYVNSAFLECFQIPDPSMIVGKFNALKDILLLNDMRLAEYIQSVFSGEVKSIREVRVPFAELFERYFSHLNKPDTDDLYQDITSFPLKDKQGDILYIITIFITKHIYKENQEVSKAKDYIRSSWREEFDIDKIADAAGFSKHHFSRIFKQYTGVTPYSYYQDIILKELMKALNNNKYTISQAFLSCGIDYSGSFVKYFNECVGMTPTQYKKSILLNNSSDENTADMRTVRNGCDTTYDIEHAMQFLDILPLPLLIFDITGSVFFANRMILKKITSKVNIKTDINIAKSLGITKYLDNIFASELILVPDIKLPMDILSNWFDYDNINNIQTSYFDILFFPIILENQIQYIISLFITTRTYKGEANIAKAIEFIENNWKDNLDIDYIANRCGYSRYHFVRKFKKHTGKTPYSYYQELKILKLMETLRDTNITISEAFDFCGLCYHGDWANLFKEKVGMTPLEYHKSLIK